MAKEYFKFDDKEAWSEWYHNFVLKGTGFENHEFGFEHNREKEMIYFIIWTVIPNYFYFITLAKIIMLSLQS